MSERSVDPEVLQLLILIQSSTTPVSFSRGAVIPNSGSRHTSTLSHVHTARYLYSMRSWITSDHQRGVRQAGVCVSPSPFHQSYMVIALKCLRASSSSLPCFQGGITQKERLSCGAHAFTKVSPSSVCSSSSRRKNPTMASPFSLILLLSSGQST